LEKAIEIKRRAQRCLQSGNLDGALSEYEKLTRAEDSEPINLVLMADLLYKKGDQSAAAERYIQAVDAYAKTGLYKNAIAVCKKMARLSLSPTVVLQRLADLHALDGLNTEASLYYQEYAERQSHEGRLREAADSLRRAFEVSRENVGVLEKASEWLREAGDADGAAKTLLEAASHFASVGQEDEAGRLKARAEELRPGAEETFEAGSAAAPAASDAPVDGLEQGPVFRAPSTAEREVEDAPADMTPPGPDGLGFEQESSGGQGLAEIEELLAQAAERFKKGEREAASDILVEAAQAYEGLERLESAAAIYRSLGRSAHASPEVMGLWLRNCELRDDPREAAEVACALGDHSLNDGDLDGAREWFARALRHVPEHELAQRRLERLGPRASQSDAAGNSAVPGASTAADGRVEVAVGRAQAVTLDLGSLISEFQRGIDSQLSDDSQSHYDLGMTYREMGLFDQAVECFRAAGRSPDFGQRSAEMIGRCLLEQGRFQEAVEEFARALEAFAGEPEASIALRFQLGLAHEVAGNTQEALSEFERVYGIQPNYPDVAQKIRVLRRALESV
jgi:tetratricopeptide (TPR) repeat protein